MELRSKTLGIIIFIVIFGGIMGASALGLWKTKSTRTPSKIQIGETAEESVKAYNPADIRGNHQFGEISVLFDIPLETLSRAFALPADVDPATFRNKDFETIYPEFAGEQEIGNGSMKWFVALYTGLPYELGDDEEDIYLLRPAVDILKSHADLTAEQIAYLDAYTIEIDFEPVEYSLPEEEPPSGGAEEVYENSALDKEVKGKTTFADLLDWGVPVEQIEAIIGGEIPNRLMLVYDYCGENGLSFGEIKTDLQAEIDKLE